MCLYLILESFYSLSQNSDSLAIDKWINFNRTRGAGDHYSNKGPVKKYVTSEKDTLVRAFSLNGEFKQVLAEDTYIHGHKNGLSIVYFPNGLIKEINYYLNDRFWDVISRSDSSGKLLYPGSLHNGSGTKYFSDDFGYEPNCYKTYKNGLPEGEFYWQSDQQTKIRGELTYKKSEVSYRPAMRVTFIYNYSGIRDSLVVDTAMFNKLFINDRYHDYKILAVTDDSVEELSRRYGFIDVAFDDPTTIPKGTWQITNAKRGRTLMLVTFADHGNPTKVITFKENGEMLSEKNYPSFGKRKW